MDAFPQVADIVLWVVSAGENVDALGEQFLTATRTLGLPTVVVVVQVCAVT